MRQLRAAVVILCLALAASPAFADVTMKMTQSMSGGPMAVDMAVVAYISGLKMRSDVKVMDQDMSLFVDVAAKQQLLVNNTTKEVQDPAAAMANMPMGLGEVRVSIKPTGQTKQVLGQTCAGFAVEVAIPMTMGDETLTVSTTGTVWLAKDAPGAAEYQAFTKAATTAGLATTPFTQGPQAKSMFELQAAISESGIPLEQDMQIGMTGTGKMAEMVAQSGMGAMRMKMTVTEISVNAIPAETLAVPAWAVKK